MSRYGVTTENPFALLGDDEDEAAEGVNAQVESAPAPKEKPKGAAGTTTTTAATTTSGGTTPPGPRGRGRGRGRGGGRRTDAPFREGPYESEYPGAARASYAGRGPRGGRGRGGPGGRMKRQFDRRDGTGRGHEFEKRHGSGKGNWGVSGEEEAEPEEVTTGWEVPEEKMEDGQAVDGEVKAEEEEPAVEEEETEKKEPAEPAAKAEEKPVFTLAEYEAMMKETMVPVTPVKKETPAVDKKQFDGMAMLKKSHEESGFEGLEVEKTRRRKERREKEVETVEVSFRVGEPIRRGRGRGRGRGRSYDADREGGEGFHRFPTDGGPSEAPQPEGGTYVPHVPRGGRGRGHFRGRGAYGEHGSRGSGRRGIDIASENVFPSLTG